MLSSSPTALAGLAADLAANPRQCTLAYWHLPRFASGSKSDEPELQPLWALLQGAGAELVITGHDHNYQRYAPQDAAGNLDYGAGMAEIVIGTGGTTSPVDPTGTNRLTAFAGSRGVLKLTLREGSFGWEFIPESGQTYRDLGEATCH